MSRLRPDRILRMAREGHVPISDAALASGYNEVTLRRLIEDGKVRCVMFGSRRFIEWAGVIAYIGPEAVRMARLPTETAEVLRVAQQARTATAIKVSAPT